MIWLRQYLSLLIPLITLLVGIESVLLINRAVSSHEEVVGKNYAIVLVAESKLNLDDIKAHISEAVALNELDSSIVLNEINSSFKDSIIDDIKKTLPSFYSLKLESFPNQYKIKEITDRISKLNGIIRVESFNKSHNQIYRILVLTKGCVIVLSSLLFVLSFLLMIKQIEVWRFEHSERMEIMTYLGAPSKFKNGPLYKLALIDSIISCVLVIFGVLVLANNSKLQSIITMLGIEIFGITALVGDFAILLLSAYAISMVSVFMVILFQKEP